ncbi:unnamed protein product [Rotaria sp. Silwood1]|nr:unnamed protein product [Rotaria sp. Silwood1]CAF5011586.1 unnamed protein product [Rotaria sp. Silwood1]CAF5126933.1 unnamed protein product [Rotaria sp. Silwood1]
MSNKAIDIFNKIENPNEIILNLLFNACAELKTNEALDLAKETSKRMSKSFHSNPYILSSFLDALMKCGDIKYAQSVFDKSKEKDLPMYGAMMKGYIIHNQLEEVINLFKEIKNPSEVNLIVFFNACAHLKTQQALDLLKKISKTMPKSYYSNHRLLNALLDGFIKCGDSSTGEILFSKMKKTVENYGNLMTGFNQENNPEKTLDLFYKMKKDNIEANIIIYLCIIKALAYIGDYSMSESIIKQIPYSFVVDNQIKAALIDMWGKNGYVEEAREIFSKIPSPDKFAYTAMINSYGLNGMGTEAVTLYYQMPQDFIDEITNICILNACSHSGLVDRARFIFQNIQNKSESIYGAMIDCLSRASFFEEAQQLIYTYERYHPSVLSMYS